VTRPRRPLVLARRALLVVVLIGAAVIPGRASSGQVRHCTGLTCRTAGSILWTRGLSGSWLAETGEAGTVPSQAGAYAASGGGIAAVGTGTTVTAFLEKSGKQLWQVSLRGIPPGSDIVGVRAFSGAVAVGVGGGQATGRDEVILSAKSGAELRMYQAAAYGGAIEASPVTAVIVGPHAVTDYSNATGRALWSRAVGPAEQTWRVAGQYIYIEAGIGPGNGAGVMVLRRISLRNGAERVVRPEGKGDGGFPGTLSAEVDGDVLFAAGNGVRAYNATTGKFLWSRPSAYVELAESGQRTVYLASGSQLIGVDVATDQVVSRAPVSVASSLYWVRGDVALGLDQNGLGEAWGYNLSTRRVAWSTSSLPWPHYFVDLSGLGGSASPGSDLVLLATCAKVGPAPSGSSQPACLQPELAAVLA